MLPPLQSFRRALRSTALCGVGCLILFPLTVQAFNPDEGEDSAVTTNPRSSLPSTAPLTGVKQPAIRQSTTSARLPSTTPLYTPMPKLAFAPLNEARRQEPAETVIAAPPSAVDVTPVPAIVTAPAQPKFLPADAATLVKAQAIVERESATTPAVVPAPLMVTKPASVIAPVPAFAPPAPLSDTSIHAVKPVPASLKATESAIDAELPKPVIGKVSTAFVEPSIPPATRPPAVTSGPDELSDASRRILSKFPSKLDKPAALNKNGAAKLNVSRMSPAVKPLSAPEHKIESYDSAGLSIKVQRPGLDENYELTRAYNALGSGDDETAIESYKTILAGDPTNEDALFGLASTYHRIGNLDKARPFYAQLLKVNPNHRDGLNNFLALVSEESPEDALAELERLELRNPDFSPIPAQEANVMMKLNMPDQARDKMLRAIELAPDNLTYKYNLAVMLDRQGHYADASALYRMLIDASLNGAKLPAQLESLQKRLNYITTAVVPQASTGG